MAIEFHCVYIKTVVRVYIADQEKAQFGKSIKALFLFKLYVMAHKHLLLATFWTW